MPLGALYLHFPFCKKKCAYCDFTSYLRAPFYEYISGLKKEFHLKRALTHDLNFNTMFLGGGTPGLIPVEWLADLLTCLKDTSLISKSAEISIEVNPESLKPENLEEYRKMGINRLSIGVQSFDDDVLKKSGRIHDQSIAIEAILNAHKNGFNNINIDLIVGLPGETDATWKMNKNIVNQLPLTHISTYMLDIAPQTRLYRAISRNLAEVSNESKVLHYFSEWITFLKDNGWQHYEISNFSKYNYACQHNIHYWKGSQYLGLGLSAVSRIGDERHRNSVHFKSYFNKLSKNNIPIAWSEKLTSRILENEYIMLGLRLLKEGIFFDHFNQMQCDIVYQWIKKGKVTVKNKKLLLSEEGVFCSNEIISSLIL